MRLLVLYTLLLGMLCMIILSTGDMIEALWKEFVFMVWGTRILMTLMLIPYTLVMAVALNRLSVFEGLIQRG